MSFPWLFLSFSDLFLSFFWLNMAFSGSFFDLPRLGYRLVNSRPILGFRIAKSCIRVGFRLAKSWPRLGFWFAKFWPRLLFRLPNVESDICHSDSVNIWHLQLLKSTRRCKCGCKCSIKVPDPFLLGGLIYNFDCRILFSLSFFIVDSMSFNCFWVFGSIYFCFEVS